MGETCFFPSSPVQRRQGRPSLTSATIVISDYWHIAVHPDRSFPPTLCLLQVQQDTYVLVGIHLWVCAELTYISSSHRPRTSWWKRVPAGENRFKRLLTVALVFKIQITRVWYRTCRVISNRYRTRLNLIASVLLSGRTLRLVPISILLNHPHHMQSRLVISCWIVDCRSSEYPTFRFRYRGE